METFFRAYRNLNIFLFIFSVCPFLQNRTTFRFECKRRHIFYLAIASFTYLAYVVTLSSFRLPELFGKLLTMSHVLKLVRALGNAYGSIVLIFLCTTNRKPHAEYFDVLLAFDKRFNQRISKPISYHRINRAFWIEFGLFSLYLTVICIIEAIFNEKMKEMQNLLFWTCEIAQQIRYTLFICHMKNCATNLLARFDRTHKLFRSLLRPSSMSDRRRRHSANHVNSYERFEYTVGLYDMLYKAQRRLQYAFGSVLLFIGLYALFTAILSLYIVLNTNLVEMVKYENRHRLYITVKYFMFEVPLVMRDVYMAIHFNDIGNQVSDDK